MSTTARHYAEKVRNLVARLDEHHANAVATLCQPEVSAETCRALQDARFTLEAELKHASAQLASVVLATSAASAIAAGVPDDECDWCGCRRDEHGANGCIADVCGGFLQE